MYLQVVTTDDVFKPKYLINYPQCYISIQVVSEDAAEEEERRSVLGLGRVVAASC